LISPEAASCPGTLKSVLMNFASLMTQVATVLRVFLHGHKRLGDFVISLRVIQTSLQPDFTA
jgi:hypothetical protein